MSEENDILFSIKSMFDQMNNRFDNLEKQLENVKQDVAIDMDTMATGITKDMKAMATDISKIKLTLENDIKRNINLLAEGYETVANNSAQIHKLSEDMETVKVDINIIKKVVTTHSTQFDKLSKAK